MKNLGYKNAALYKQAVMQDNIETIVKLVNSGEFDFGDKYIKAYKILEVMRDTPFSFSENELKRTLSVHTLRLRIRELVREGRIPKKKYLFLTNT